MGEERCCCPCALGGTAAAVRTVDIVAVVGDD